MDAYIEDISDGELLLKDTADASILPDIYGIEPTVRYCHGMIDTQL